MIYIIKGKNGAGKTFLANKLYELGYNRAISYTTREPRETEREGYDYKFITKEKFEQLIEDDFFAEYQSRDTTYYGTSVESIKDKVILISSDEKKVARYYKEKIAIIYVEASIEKRYQRVSSRGTSKQEIFSRFHNENMDFLYDFRGTFINNEEENDSSLKQLINSMEKPESIENRTFLKRKLKEFNAIDTEDELLAFLQFEEYLLRGIYIDKRIEAKEIQKIYVKYITKFAERKNILFEHNGNGLNHIRLNNEDYYYKLDSNKIKGKEEKENEKEIN